MKKKTLIRLLTVLNVVFWIVVVFFLVVSILNTYSSYHPRYKFEGRSVYPTIQDGYVVILDETPFDELQVGDIIRFKMRVDYERKTHFQNNADTPFTDDNYTIPPKTTVENPPMRFSLQN